MNTYSPYTDTFKYTFRYGFNGKEDDRETGFQDYGMRQYNTKLGRFFSVDPFTKKYPELTPYQFASNTPIQAIDLDGLEALIVVNSTWYTNKIQAAFPSPQSHSPEDSEY